MGGYVVPEWVKAQALDKLVPQEQLSIIVSRPALADHKARLLRVKAQVEHARGATQAQQVSATAALEMETSVWAQCCKMLPVDPRMLKSHLCCGTSTENVPSLQLGATGMASTW